MAATPAGGARLAPLRLKAQRFWRWWTGELLALVPQRFTAFTSNARVPLVAIEDGALTVLEPRAAEGHGENQVAVDALEAPQAMAVVRGLLERVGESRGRARLALSPGEALVRRVTMPAATEENLAAVLGFEMDRLTPFRADEVYFDHRVIGRDAATGTLSVLLGVARRDLVEARLARARELGLSVQGVAVGDDPARSAPTLDVLPSAERGEREKPRERRVKQGLAAAAVLLLIVALTLPAMRKRAEVHAIKPVLDKAHTEAQATDALIRELDRLVGDHNFLLARRHGTYPSLAYIEEVTRLMPDNTWLQQFEIKQAGKAREILMTGETVSSSRLIEILEQSRLIQNATPRGAVTRGTQPGTERFVIAAEIRPRPQPEAGELTDTQAAIALAPAYAPPQALPDAGATPPRSPTSAPTSSEGLIFRPGGRTYVPPDFVPPPSPPK
jgi:general secretion pathway protein L